MPNPEAQRPRCFIALPYRSFSRVVRSAIEESAETAGFEVVSLDRLAMKSESAIQEVIVGEIARADCMVADMTGRNPNVFFEVGLAQAMGKGLFLVLNSAVSDTVPTDLRGYQYLVYDETEYGIGDLRRRLEAALRAYKISPGPTRSMAGAALARPFFVDWDRLDRSDAENLINELLAQMGYRRIDWEKESKEIDLVAELPRKDPDGFEYRELWFVAMGRNVPIERLLELASFEPEYFLYQLIGDVERLERLASRGTDAPITVLIIDWKGDRSLDSLQFRFRHSKRSRGGSIRVRVWDRNYLTSLVHQFPLLGYKYFSDEAQSRSRHRKTYEELYKENVTLTIRLTRTLSALETEKDKRVRAERDAVWKDISFSAAHKIGNPIFAIETNLDPLETRVKDVRTVEALDVVKGIRDSVEKAKAIIDQFKSLTRAQQIEPVQMLLRPVLEDACRMLENEDVVCEIQCDPDLSIQGDPDRLAECFDEMVRNSTHWFDKTEKRIKIEAIQPAGGPLPESLEAGRKYTLIRVCDNGSGVPLEIKTKIFDAFFTKRDHGTGIGLALVRRVIEGHAGLIVESGIPGQGATFEIYLPIVTELGKKTAAKTKPSPKKKTAAKTMPSRKKKTE
jgi:signal transduction histidine kinase